MTSPVRIALEIEDPRWTEDIPDIETLIIDAVSRALAAIDAKGRPIEVGVRLVDDGTIRALNREWRGKDKPTNVLSFPLGDPGPVADADFPWLIGDIVMSYDTMFAEAARDGKPVAHHIAHLAVHSALHLSGHDHEDEAEAEAMETIEVALLAGMGIPDPYADPISAAP